ncbi:uncharacterized protein CTHT_0058040 [Thermochaetoides thermophila DSM 1495]|uniref:Uncharacterized protein n=1 Tax=Chaetomium thermophilum (strain DSM 1495 / CBS 144.50 / IMI 039719) TaxID=759272 RepID=G0SCQ3_CHATD|nr:hypothetical protein CTHT_0058040 [Thermochaetoides thermophila DSM 1495]EGS19179.1 hypothetical protein CTHT_0058040 [Thermochaetoides thermophila DSM 1495]
MGLLNLTRSRDSRSRRPKLPLYREVPRQERTHRSQRSPTTKERYSDSSDTSDDEEEDDDDLTDASSDNSRHTSASTSSSAAMISAGPTRRNVATAQTRRPATRKPKHLYRLPNRVIRCLCIGMITTIIIFILVLIRASQLENRRIAEAHKNKRPAANNHEPPPPWEKFDFLTRYYGGVKTLVLLKENKPQYPPLTEGEELFNVTKPQTWQAEVQKRPMPKSKPFGGHPSAVLPTVEGDGIRECSLDEEGLVKVPGIRYLEGRPSGFPENILGSYELLSLPEDICFDRFGRYGPYGYGYSVGAGGLGVGEEGDREGAELVWEGGRKVDYRKIDWANVQRRCYQANAERYKPYVEKEAPPRGFYIGDGLQLQSPKVQGRDTTDGHTRESTTEEPAKPTGNLPRTAVVLRCWDEFVWREEDILNLRALISELSLASGGSYDVHLLVQVRNDAANPVWADEETYRRHINETIPEEFRGLVTFWSQTQMLAVYQGILDLWTRGPNLPVHGSYRGLQMAMQYFAHNHPEYDYFWQWEMDIRYIGHYLDLFTKLERWAKEQPRKGLWERNGRYYVPAVHGSWEDFKQMVRVQVEHGTVGVDNPWDLGNFKEKTNNKSPSTPHSEQPIWGPLRPESPSDWLDPSSDPSPPTTYEQDAYTWGVGEDADLITLSPIFDPDGTTWPLADDITGYNTTSGPRGKPPRRAQIITASRMSRRLLLLMHRHTFLKKQHAFPEMWPATVALHHGLKAVYAPHPVYVDRAWPTEYLAGVLNAGKNGASGGARTSVYGEREHNMRGLTWFYNAGFAGNLYKRWMGLRVNNDGGEEFEVVEDMGKEKDGSTPGRMKGGEGRMCLPPMLVHPVKEVELPVVKGAEGEERVEGLGPDA